MATKKDIETVTDAAETTAETVEKEVKKVAKKAAPKAAKTAKTTETAAEPVVKEAKKTTKKAAPKAAAAAEPAAEEVKKTTKKAAPKAAAAAETTAETVKKTAKKAAPKAAAAADTDAEEAKKTVKKAAPKAAEPAETVAKAEEKSEAPAKPEKKAEAPKPEKKPEKKAKSDKGEMKKLEGTPRLKQRYMDEVAPVMRTKFGYTNVMQTPRLEKVIINMGLGAEKDNPKGIEAAITELGIIAGQKAVVTRAKKSVANFKVREGMTIGAKVTLRGNRMYYFVDKLFNIVLPRVRDFRGVSDKAFDGRGNYALGLKEQLIFPEVNYDDVDKVRGMNVVFVTSAKTDEECKELLSQLGIPFAQG